VLHLPRAAELYSDINNEARKQESTITILMMAMTLMAMTRKHPSEAALDPAY
jgi:hypothetical protein